MPANQYSSNWAYDLSSNALTPSAWAALSPTIKGPGFVPGIALSEHMNTLMRQLTTSMAGIAKYVETKGSVDQLDNGSVNDYFLAFKSAMDNVLAQAQASAAPVGAIMPFAGLAVPADWLPCNGANVLASSYPQLLSVIGNLYGTGGGLFPTWFTLPDLRGMFLRGWDSLPDGSISRNVDPGRVIGLTQAPQAELPNHQHYNGVAEDTAGIFVYGSTTDGMPGTSTGSIQNVGGGNVRQGLTSQAGLSRETRPWNVAVNFIIRAR